MIDESEPAFVSGDRIYGGDAKKWKRFANSLKCRLAIHVSKVDSNWKTYIAEALASGVFQGNADNATYRIHLQLLNNVVFISDTSKINVTTSQLPVHLLTY